MIIIDNFKSKIDILANMKYIIEHLDPKVFEWCLLEYTHISEIVGKDNLLFTNTDDIKLKSLGQVKKESVTTMDPEKACILDPFAEETLSPDDTFSTLIFGGVLGDHPMQRRTEKTLSSKMPNCKIRNLGTMQMSTDTAVLVAKMIIEDKIPFENIDFQDELEIELEPNESIQLPYRYVKQDGKVVLPEGFMRFIKENRGFD